MQVMVTVARRCGCLTGICNFFQLFEPCKTGGWETILHQSDGKAEWSATVRCSPFLEETSERGEFLWTASVNADGANGLGVEKLRGESTSPLTKSVAQMGHGSRKYSICTFFVGTFWCRSMTVFCNVTAPYGTLLSEESCDLSCFLCFPWLEHEYSVSPT